MGADLKLIKYTQVFHKENKFCTKISPTVTVLDMSNYSNKSCRDNRLELKF